MVALGIGLAMGPGQALGQRPVGIDISHWDSITNWAYVRASGVTFAWAKATQGTDYTDPTFTNYAASAKSAGVLVGAYHFATPTNNLGTAGAAAEAAHFWAVASNYVREGGAYLMPMLDVEQNLSWANPPYTKATLSAWVNTWCSNVVNLAAVQGVTVKPVIYTGVSYGSTWLNSTVTNWTPWIANWNGQDPQTGGPSGTSPWATWVVWQYTDSGVVSGITTNCDVDVVSGTNALATLVIGGWGPPYWVSQPSSRWADQGGAITMTAPAGGQAPLRYQWRFNGVDLADATNSSCAFTNIQTSNAGNYTVVVTNAAGAITSSVAVLTVNPLFTPVFADDFDLDTHANWTVNQSSTDTRVGFAYDYAHYGIPSAPHSAGGTTRGLKFEANMTAGVAAALNISPSGQSFSGNYRLHYDLWMNANGPFPAGGTGSTQHQTAGLGTAGNHVQWNSGAADGVWFAADGEGQATDTSAALPDWRAYVGTTLQATNSGVYTGGIEPNVRGNGHPYYQNVFPGGQSAPAVQGQTGTLAVGTIGFAWRDVVINKTGNTIEWFIDGLKIAAVTNATLSAGNIFIGYWDSFASISDNTNLTFGLVDNLRVEVPAVAPAIAAQPQPVWLKVTSNATFTVTATGVPAPAYQWRFNGTNIAGATDSSYTRTNVQYAERRPLFSGGHQYGRPDRQLQRPVGHPDGRTGAVPARNVTAGPLAAIGHHRRSWRALLRGVFDQPGGLAAADQRHADDESLLLQRRLGHQRYSALFPRPQRAVTRPLAALPRNSKLLRHSGFGFWLLAVRV